MALSKGQLPDFRTVSVSVTIREYDGRVYVVVIDVRITPDGAPAARCYFPRERGGCPAIGSLFLTAVCRQDGVPGLSVSLDEHSDYRAQVTQSVDGPVLPLAPFTGAADPAAAIPVGPGTAISMYADGTTDRLLTVTFDGIAYGA